MSEIKDFFARLSRVMARDARYKEDAYLFVMSSLSIAVQSLETPRHITGNELLQGIRAEAEQQFGPMAATVFSHWGIKNSLDFGHIVFNMVQEGILSKTDADTLEDFEDPIFFEDLFDAASGYRLAAVDDEMKDLSKLS